jgi:hypothetical protein
LTETESRLEFTKSWEEMVKRELLLDTYKVAVWGDEKFWKQIDVIVAQLCEHE